MRKLISKSFIFLGVLSMVLGTLNIVGQSMSYAEDLELRGTNIGLEVIPTSTRLFDLQNLNPGDVEEGKVTIKNNYIAPFNLYMRAERDENSPLPPAGEVDLFEQMILTVNLRGNEVYSGSMKDFATSDELLGRFNPNDIEELGATISLLGPETGNEYQGKSVDVNWIFTATSEGPPVDPVDPPGDRPDRDDEPRIVVVPGPTELIIIEEDEVPRGEPEVPEEEELIELEEEEIPKGQPEIPEEEELVEIKEEEIPKGVPKLPKTGELSPIIFYGAGMMFILVGTQLGFKKKK